MLRYICSRQDFYGEVQSKAVWRRLVDTIFRNCKNIWQAVKDVLCIDSPEGFNFDEEEIENLGVGTKDTLSFSWRALKESRLASSPCRLPDLLSTYSSIVP